MKTIPLKNICDISMGQAPPGNSYNSEGNGVPLIAGAGDFGSLFPDSSRYTTKPTRATEKGDIVLCVRATIGDVNWADTIYCLGRGVAGLRPHRDSLFPHFLWYWLQASKEQLIREGHGSTFKQVNREAIETLQVPLPPLPEQRRIAAVLDKADAIRRKRKEAIKLTEEFLRSVFLDMFGDPVTNPKGWEKKALGEIADVNRGKFSARPRNDPQYYHGDFPFIQTGDLRGCSGFLRNWKQTLNEKGTTVSKSFPKGTIAIAIAANIGDTAILDFKSYFPDSVVGINVHADIAATEYIEYTIRFYQNMLRDKAPETAQKNINLQVLRPLKIPLPPLRKQKAFTSIYLNIYRQIDEQGRFKEQTTVLFNSLAQRAFRGDLCFNPLLQCPSCTRI